MNKRTALHQHIHGNIVARIIYRFVCLVLMLAGIFGLYLTYATGDYAYDYMRRDKTAQATVIQVNKVQDPNYDYTSCELIYTFNTTKARYTNAKSLVNAPTPEACYLNTGQVINVRYQNNNPYNTAYNDNTTYRNASVILTIGLAILSALPLGLGFIGLVAIHRVMKKYLRNHTDSNLKTNRRTPTIGSDR